MSFLLTCPNCGPRRVDEFRFGGEIRPGVEGQPSPSEWGAYLYERANIDGPQEEWWYHRQGCKRWFVATRDTTTNTVLDTTWLTTKEEAPHAQRPDPPAPQAVGTPGARPG